MENDLIVRVRGDAYFDPIKGSLEELLDPASFIGRAPAQVDVFVRDWVTPALAGPELQDAIGKSVNVQLNV